MNSDATLENNDEESDTPKRKYYNPDIYHMLRKTPLKCRCEKWPLGYRPDSIERMYHPEYTHERSGEKLYKLIQNELVFKSNYRELLSGCDFDYMIYYFSRHMKRFATFIRYRLDSTWCRRIVSLIDAEYPDKGMDFIFTLWCYSKQIIVLDSELAVMLIKQAHIEYITGKPRIYDYVLRELIKLINAFNLDVDRCLNEVYGISSFEIKMLNDYIMDMRLRGISKNEKFSIKRHGMFLEYDDKTYKIYDVFHQIFLWN